MSNNDLISRAELAAALHCSISTVKRIEKEGKLTPIKISQRIVRYSQAEAEKLIPQPKKN